MRQYELAIRIAQVHHLVDERKYKKALAVIQTIDMRQVRSLSDLKAFAEVYTKTEQYEAAKATYLRIYRRSRTRRVLYRLIYLSIRTNALEDAEAYYQEFVRMNPSTRDALILRYRIDKASGMPVGQLIGTLQELKQEEYIEEWAYELAKLYHRAGRREECLEECNDILLWFGTGEIVERAKILIDHLQEKDPMPYYDDKDFTVPKEEEPNPDDTGSLPNIKEFLKERKAESKEEREEAVPIEKEDKWGDEEDANAFIDDYEEDDFGQEGIALPHVAKKLSGFLKLGKKEEERPAEKILNDLLAEKPERNARMEKKPEVVLEKKPVKKSEETTDKGSKINVESKPEKSLNEKVSHIASGVSESINENNIYNINRKEVQEKKDVPKEDMLPNRALSSASTDADSITEKVIEYIPPHSQSGTGITKDLAKEISAIYEMEHQGQLMEKAVTVINNAPDAAVKEMENNLQDRMQEETQDKAQDRIQEEIQDKAPVGIQEEIQDKAPAGIQEEIQVRAQNRTAGTGRREPDRMVDKTERPINIATNVVDRMTQAIQKSAAKSYIPLDIEEIQKTQTQEEQKDPLTKALDEEVEQYYEEQAKKASGVESGQPYEEKEEQHNLEEEPVKEEQQALEEELVKGESQDLAAEPVLENEMEVPELPEEPQKSETEQLKDLLNEEIQDPEPMEQGSLQEEESENLLEEKEPEQEVADDSEPENSLEEEEPEQEVAGDSEPENSLEEEESEQKENTGSPLEQYHAPDIPVVQTDYMEMPEITFEDLPTTRALQQSFQNVLKLIEGELDPSHFVLMGDGAERIVGVSKQIIRIMKDTGYLSQGRIAKINAEKLNKMDLITFRGQLKGNCLLIENASDLLFPTITKIFSIMEEYYGDFVVILADEGTTLDQLFRFVPALARKFKYIIDISKYTKEDYQ